MEQYESNSDEIQVTIEVLLKDSHPAIAEHAGYFCRQLGEVLLQNTGEDRVRGEIANAMGLPAGKPFKLTIHAAHASHGEYRDAIDARGKRKN